MLLQTNADQYSGKIISHFEDEHGNKLKSLLMCEHIIIVFYDGDRISLRIDVRGTQEYISQYDRVPIKEGKQ